MPDRALVLRIEPPMASRPVRASIADAFAPAVLRAVLAMRMPWLGTVLLFPSSLHAVLAVKVGACLARWRPGGRLRTLTAALRRAASGLGQFRPDSFQGERP